MSSFEIHLKVCKKKWEDQESKKSPKDRKPLPEPPTILEKILTDSKNGTPISRSDLDTLNEETFKSYLDNRMECSVCGRKFDPDRLEVHKRSHKDGSRIELKEEQNKPISPITPKSVTCYIW